MDCPRRNHNEKSVRSEAVPGNISFHLVSVTRIGSTLTCVLGEGHQSESRGQCKVIPVERCIQRMKMGHNHQL